MPAKKGADGLVLLIDDVEDNRDVYTQFLTFHGINVLTASDGVVGLEVAVKAKPHFIGHRDGFGNGDAWTAIRARESDFIQRGRGVWRIPPVPALPRHEISWCGA